MNKTDKLLQEAEGLPTAEKWRMVKRLLRSLEQEQAETEKTDWHQFLRETYGSLRDIPFERQPQGEYEERESFE